MSKKTGLDKLRNSIGKRVHDICIEFWAESQCPISVGIAFDGGPELYMCCAGDGNVRINNGVIRGDRNNTLVRFIEFAGKCLSSVETTTCSVCLGIANYRLSIFNCDDELEIILKNENGHKVDLATLASATQAKMT